MDGRRERGRQTRAKILASCSYLMEQGHFRPTMEQCCKDAGCSYRAGHHHFKTTAALHKAALEDSETVAIICRLVVNHEVNTATFASRIARVAVLGKI